VLQCGATIPSTKQQPTALKVSHLRQTDFTGGRNDESFGAGTVAPIALKVVRTNGPRALKKLYTYIYMYIYIRTALETSRSSFVCDRVHLGSEFKGAWHSSRGSHASGLAECCKTYVNMLRQLKFVQVRVGSALWERRLRV
jgi:hypothetical protein